MTLIVGLKSGDNVVIGAEQEESGGIAAKRLAKKLKLINGSGWSVVIGGSGDSAVAENAMRFMERLLLARQTLNEQVLTDITDEVLDSVFSKYIDKDPNNEGLSLVIGASCGNELHLISTTKRVPQLQDSIAYAGVGADIGIFFLDRLHLPNEDWVYSSTVVGFTLQQAIEASRFCGGESEIYVLQCPPNPRWRSLGDCDVPCEFINCFSASNVSRHLGQLIRGNALSAEGRAGYSDEHHPNAVTLEETMKNYRLKLSVSEKSEPEP
jgi:hypothetical protein